MSKQARTCKATGSWTGKCQSVSTRRWVTRDYISGAPNLLRDFSSQFSQGPQGTQLTWYAKMRQGDSLDM